MTEHAKRWLRVEEAAEYLAIGKSTLNKLRIYGGGPCYVKLDRSIVYDVLDLDAWASAKKIRSTRERASGDYV